LGVCDLIQTANLFSAHRSLASHQTQGTRWFLIFAGAILGVTAALLWSAQGCIMMSYPLENDKGKAFGVFWAIFQFGSFIGAIIALAINLQARPLGCRRNIHIHREFSARTPQFETPRTRVRPLYPQAFLVIIFFGIASAFMVLPPHRIVRSDGTIVKVDDQSSVSQELRGLWERLKDWRILGASRLFYPPFTSP
jgi:MFS family permease